MSTAIEFEVNESESLTTWGACGIEGCAECLPRFNADNEPIIEVAQK